MSSEDEQRTDAGQHGPQDAGGVPAGERDDEGRSLEERDLTDPKTMRALAHPVRMALLELLGVNDTLTATQASELLGESPANCAFHLRTLAKYGFVEETGGGRGRERPWRWRPMSIHIDSEKLDAPASIAAETLSSAWMERTFTRARQALRRGTPMPEGWEHAPTSVQTQVYLTREELVQLRDGVHELFKRFDTRHNKATSPDGAQPVEMVFLGYPLTGVTLPENDD